MRYSTSTEKTRAEMLAAVGAGSMEELLRSIPSDVRMKRPLEIEGPLPESTLLRRLDALKSAPPRVSLMGAGLYRHLVPSPVDALCARSEWVTSYTPYQPELAQGTLMMYFEFQSYIAALTGQEIANGGMYDGSTACTEGVLMAMRLREKAKRLYVSAGLHPEYREVLDTFLKFHDVEVTTLPLDPKTGRTRFDVSAADQDAAVAVVVQSPNFFGVIEDGAGLSPKAFVVSACAEAMSMAVLKPFPASIATGECQSFGIPMQLGGPTAGFFATKKDFVRQLPGRLVGKTVDADGKDALCITLATREQFIRREKATSNICTASGLMCLRATTYLSLMGRDGVRDVAVKSAKAAQGFAKGLAAMGFPTVFSGAFFNEFVVDMSKDPELPARLEKAGFLLGIPLDRWFPEHANRRLVALTEYDYPNVPALVEEVKSHARHS